MLHPRQLLLWPFANISKLYLKIVPSPRGIDLFKSWTYRSETLKIDIGFLLKLESRKVF
jgi:hypothetical protein